MARGRGYDVDPELERLQREALRAQTEQTRGETAAQQQKMQLAAQELGLRQTAESRQQQESAASISKMQQLLPLEKLLALSRAGEPESQERMNQLKTVVDLMQLRENARTRAAALKQNFQSDLVRFAADRPDVFPLPTLAATLRKGGNTDMADVLDQAHMEHVQKQAGALYSTARATTGTAREQVLHPETLKGGVPLDPDVLNLVQKRLASEPEQAPTAAAPREQYPGYVAQGTLKYAPIDLINALSATANVTAVPLSNLINSALGAPPMQKAPILPRDYRKAWEVLNQ